MRIGQRFRWRIAQTLELRWWKRYLKNQQPALYVLKKKQYWWRVLEATGVHPALHDRILDAGCGPAGIFTILEGYAVDASDPLIEAYAHNLDHFKPAAYPWVHFYALPLERGAPNPPYDLIYCTNAINHVQDLQLALHTLLDALKPGGRMLLTIDVHRSTLLKYIFRWLPGDVLHPQQHDLQDYLRILADAGVLVQRTLVLKPGNIFNYVAIVLEKERLLPV